MPYFQLTYDGTWWRYLYLPGGEDGGAFHYLDICAVVGLVEIAELQAEAQEKD